VNRRGGIAVLSMLAGMVGCSREPAEVEKMALV